MKNKDERGDLNVVWLGESGFPYGMAAIQKTIVLADTLTKAGAQVNVINRKGTFDPGQHSSLGAKGKYKGINYVYASGTIYRPQNIFTRNFMKIKGAMNEFAYLWKMRSKNKLQIAIVSNMSFMQTLLYRFYGVLLNFPVLLIFVEMASKMKHREGALLKINDYLVDNFLVKRMSGVLPISEFLIEYYQTVAPGKPFLKIPSMCDFENFNIPKRKIEQSYFLFCGAFDYREVIDFILESFGRLDDDLDIKLFLIVSGGSPKQYEEFNNYLRTHNLTDKTRVFSNIPFSELVDLYINADALLIPLRPTEQDIARFPHKISEYTATGNPIISTNYGEVKHYFTDGENALIASSFDTSEFANKMKFVIDNPEKAKQVGLRGKELGLNEFSHLKYGPLLKDFLHAIIEERT